MNRIRQDLSIGSNIRNLRKQSKMTQEQVIAKMQLMNCNITRSIYSRYETGELNIRVSDLVALKNIFACTFDNFFKNINIRQ